MRFYLFSFACILVYGCSVQSYRNDYVDPISPIKIAKMIVLEEKGAFQVSNSQLSFEENEAFQKDFLQEIINALILEGLDAEIILFDDMGNFKTTGYLPMCCRSTIMVKPGGVNNPYFAVFESFTGNRVKLQYVQAK